MMRRWLRACSLALVFGLAGPGPALVLVTALVAPLPAVAGELVARARVLPQAVAVRATPAGAEIELGLSLGVPYRIASLDAPERLVIDFKEVDWEGFDARSLVLPPLISDARAGLVRPGWSRLVLLLGRPVRVVEAAMQVSAEDGTARLALRLAATDRAGFLADLSPPEPGAPAAPAGAVAGRGPSDADAFVVVIDPGHGGIDPGAVRGGLREADAVLALARGLAEELRRVPGVRAVLTRNDDRFVSLEQRVAIARHAGADVFLSIHADSLLRGQAEGAAVFTLAREASDAASAALAERHDRADILAGVDLAAKADDLAEVLIDLARNETAPRTEALAAAIVAAIAENGGRLHPKPLRHASFSVLKAPDIPSVLIEAAFLSNPRERARLTDPGWRRHMARALREAIMRWREDDRAQAALRRH